MVRFTTAWSDDDDDAEVDEEAAFGAGEDVNVEDTVLEESVEALENEGEAV